MKYYVGILSITLLLLGCTSTGGIIGGLIPAPKLTKGTLSDGLYIAQDESFSVKSPFEKDSYEYTYMEIAENYSKSENNIQFSTSAAPAEVYRVNIFKNVSSEENLDQATFAQYRQKFEDAYHTPFENEQSESITISGILVVLNTYSQHIPERSSLGQSAHELDVLHSCFYLEKNRNSAFVCVNRIAPEKQGGSQEAEGRVLKFIKSFKIQ
jgi:hypothetical protein